MDQGLSKNAIKRMASQAKANILPKDGELEQVLGAHQYAHRQWNPVMRRHCIICFSSEIMMHCARRFPERLSIDDNDSGLRLLGITEVDNTVTSRFVFFSYVEDEQASTIADCLEVFRVKIYFLLNAFRNS